MLHGCVAEIIPIEPDADNAAAGIVSFYTYTLFVINETVFYLVSSFEKTAIDVPLQTDMVHEIYLCIDNCRL